MTKKLRIVTAILLALLLTIYLTLVIASLWMLFVISFPYHGEEETPMDRQIGYAMFSVIFIVSSICSTSGLLHLYKKNVNSILIWPLYLFLPISIPYLLIEMKIKNHNEAYEINDRLFSVILLTVTSFINYLLAFPSTIFAFVLLLVAEIEPWSLYFGIPLFIIYMFMIVGTTANIINYYHPNRLANRISYIGFTLVWVYKFYKTGLIKNNLHLIKTLKIKVT